MKYYLIDNQRCSILQFFQENAGKYNHLCIATGYIDLPALSAILPLIKEYQSIKILIGQEPLIRRYKKDKVEHDFPKLDLVNDLQDLSIDPRYTETIRLTKDLIRSGKLNIKIFKRTFLHAKCYILQTQDHLGALNSAVGIIGSSNLTRNGISSNSNIELNHIEHNEMIVKYPATDKEPHLIGHYAWFNQLWNENDSESWEGQFTEILDTSPVGELMFSQYEMYIKTLWELYQDEIEVHGEQISHGYTLFEYQVKNANSLCKRLEKRQLAMLCDSVGLGKTITALEVIARYVKNGKRVVIICPKSLQKQWKHAVRKQGLNLDVISLHDEGELSKHMKYDHYAPVGLFVIDESHNLRTGSTSSRFETVRQWINRNKSSHSLLLTATPINNSITDLLNQILLGSGGDANVLMIPTSNGGGMRNVVDVINSIRQSEGSIKELTPELIAARRAKLHPILKEFVVRRTRQGILREQEVSDFEPKLQFPQEKLQARSYGFNSDLSRRIIQQTTKVDANTIKSGANTTKELIKKIYLIPELYSEYNQEKNEYIEKTLDDRLNILVHPVDQLDNFTQLHPEKYLDSSSPLRLVYQIIQFLGFIPYRYMIYHHDFYGKNINDVKLLPPTPQHKVLNRQKGLYGILRIVFLKRLESSFYALRTSLKNYRDTLNTFKGALEKQIISPLSQLRESIKQHGDDYDSNDSNAYIDETAHFEFTEFNHEQMQLDMKKELTLLDVLDMQLDLLAQDNNKIKNLAELFNTIQKDCSKYNNGRPKILVFSYFADTVRHLEAEFKNYFQYNENECVFITSTNRNNIDDLTSRFAPQGKDYQLKPNEQELRYLFATDVLSEGQNLQDCAILINYDLHWNPVRMIQRNGRVNRIGSTNSTVLIYNMHPDSQLEEYLKLVKRLEYKIGLIRDIVGQDQRILNAHEELNPIEFIDDIEIDKYAIAIDKLQSLYSSDDKIATKTLSSIEENEEYLTDDKFITDLRYFDSKYKNDPEYKKAIYSMPRGKFGLLTSSSRQLLIFTQMNDQNHNKLFNKFFIVNRNGKSPQGIDDLHALQLIRTDESNNQRHIGHFDQTYLPYLNKDFSQKFIATLQGVNTRERELDTGMQNLRIKFLWLLKNMEHAEQATIHFEQALLYSNYSDYKWINKMLKKLLKAPNTNDINQLLSFCKTAICEASIMNMNERAAIMQPSSCEGVLYYGN